MSVVKVIELIAESNEKLGSRYTGSRQRSRQDIERYSRCLH